MLIIGKYYTNKKVSCFIFICIVILVCFALSSAEYLLRRYKTKSLMKRVQRRREQRQKLQRSRDEKVTKNIIGDNHETFSNFTSDPDEYIDTLEAWIVDSNIGSSSKKNNNGNGTGIGNSTRISSTPEWCKNLVLQIPSSALDDDSDDTDICDKMRRGLCRGIEMKRVNIPPKHDSEYSSESEFYASNGSRLQPGCSYCLHKQPPMSDFNKRQCDDVWGFWQFSPVYERWICKSKVPGFYNAQTNSFDACTKEDPRGRLLFDGEPVEFNVESSSVKDLSNYLTPEDFYSADFQDRFQCQCPSPGYISMPELCKTSCYIDPCISGLPRFAAAPGYNRATGNCDCGEHFSNTFDDPLSPCTACPTSTPSFDEKTNILTIYIKCYNEDEEEEDLDGDRDEVRKKKRDDNYDDNYDDDDDRRNKRRKFSSSSSSSSFGLFPCKSREDKIRGCMTAKVRVKPMTQSALSSSRFEDRIFF